MRLRHISELRFHYDDSFDTGMRVSELLSDLDRSAGAIQDKPFDSAQDRLIDKAQDMRDENP
jgi:hypothetical protein